MMKKSHEKRAAQPGVIVSVEYVISGDHGTP